MDKAFLTLIDLGAENSSSLFLLAAAAARVEENMHAKK
jgi:hypothetical protein